VKVSRRSIYTRSKEIPSLKFAPAQHLTAFGGLVIFMRLFGRLDLWSRIDRCFATLSHAGGYTHGVMMRCLVVHLLLGRRHLRERDFYAHDPLVCQCLGLQQIPSVPTLSRLLASTDEVSIQALRQLNLQMVLDRLAQQDMRTLTLDFDGSVLSTSRHAQGTAVGFNKQKKGARSYYPLFCHVAQTGQVLDVHHRSGNIHDSNGAVNFVRACVRAVRQHLGARQRLEVRMDSAFFSEELIEELDALQVYYTVSVPFERFTQLKEIFCSRKRWWQTPGREGSHYFEQRWKPKCWGRRRRFVFVSHEVGKQDKEPLQLDLFRPVERGVDFKVILTNHTMGAGRVVSLHEGRGSQEKVFGELKSQVQLGYVPCRRLHANQTWLLGAMMAHNLGRELQMEQTPPPRELGVKRTARWVFAELGTLRRTVLHQVGRLTRPQGSWTLTLPDIPALRAAFEGFGFAVL
jgi:hypothetical protein